LNCDYSEESAAKFRRGIRVEENVPSKVKNHNQYFLFLFYFLAKETWLKSKILAFVFREGN